MLTAHNISKSYSIHQILDNITFSVNAGDRVGLIGPNGCGKTTLLRILAGSEKSDSGVVTYHPPHLRIGFLTQGLKVDPDLTIEDVLHLRAGDPRKLEKELAQLATSLAEDPDREELQAAYAEVLRRLESMNPSILVEQESILENLGLGHLTRDQRVEQLSGGQKARLDLAILLMNEPELLLLDEPTNHLDIEMLEWLEDWLSSFPGAALLVSHDRTFLDRSVNRILDLDPESHTIKEYTGNYSDYLEQYLQELEKQSAAYGDQVYEIRRMRQDIARTKQQSLRVELTTTSRQPGVRRYAKKVAKKAKSREKKLKRYLQSDDRVEKPKQSWQMKLELATSEHQSQNALSLEDISIGYAIARPLLSGLNMHVTSGSRIAFTGPNGTGKTTLLKTIAGLIEPLAGRLRLGISVRIGYMSQEQEMLDMDISALETIQRQAPLNETAARSFLHFFLFSGDDSLRPVRELSFGERARLSLARLVAQGSNFLLLDEPINHLDIPSRERFEQALAQFDGTILAVVHDRYFIKRLATELWKVEGRNIRRELLRI
ncbi:MAG: ABC-F family ATP-binding cassette domain-containing protein [Anaerolineales bacterium]